MLSHDPTLRTLQVASLAIISGTFIFLAVVVMLKWGQPTETSFSPLAILGLVAAAGGLVASLVIPKAVLDKQRQKIIAAPAGSEIADNKDVAQAVVASVLSRFALLEGVAILNLIVFLLEGNWTSMVVALVLIAWMTCQFPTKQRLENALS